ncbi:MAG: hypothetical protein J6A83_02060 [Clostridia bacterium]|nr:hypothetical protein [Clostridia bacterium]
MKKVLSICLALAILLSLSVTLTSCLHRCKFSEDWSGDDTAHWHACISEGCSEVADKADHTWDEGKITTEATQEADGVKTFTCSVCSLTKTEAVSFNGLSKEAWEAAFDISVFENFSYNEVGTTTGKGVSAKSEALYKFTKDSATIKMTIADETQSRKFTDKESTDKLRKQLVDSIKELVPYESYEYDAETKTYKAVKAIEIAAINSSTSDITLKFDGGKLVEIKYSVEFTQSNIDFTAEYTVTISDYGTVTIATSI